MTRYTTIGTPKRSTLPLQAAIEAGGGRNISIEVAGKLLKEANMKKQTGELAEQPHRLESEFCPLCKIDRPIYRDKQMRRYFARHQRSGSSEWCDNSGKAVTA